MLPSAVFPWNESSAAFSVIGVGGDTTTGGMICSMPPWRRRGKSKNQNAEKIWLPLLDHNNNGQGVRRDGPKTNHSL